MAAGLTPPVLRELGQPYRVWWEEADQVDPVKFERLDPISFYRHPSCNGTPACSCPDCRAKT